MVDAGFTLVEPLVAVEVKVPGVMATLAAPVVTQLSELVEPELMPLGVALKEVMVGFAAFTVKLRETGAPLAGEMSGHVFFKDRWYGFDDGLYTGARMLEILSRVDDPSKLLNALPNSLSTPELQLKLNEGENFTLIAAMQKNAKFTGADDVLTIDGLRVEYPDGFGLARSSNTTPVVVMSYQMELGTSLRAQMSIRRKSPD